MQWLQGQGQKPKPKKPWAERSLWSKCKIVVKDKSNSAVHFIRPITYYGFIPFVIYLGMTTEPRPSLKSLLLAVALVDG